MNGVAHLWLAANCPLLERGFNVELFVCPRLYLIEEFNNSCVVHGNFRRAILRSRCIYLLTVVRELAGRNLEWPLLSKGTSVTAVNDLLKCQLVGDDA